MAQTRGRWTRQFQWHPPYYNWQEMRIIYEHGTVTFERHSDTPSMLPTGIRETGQIHLRDLPRIWDLAQMQSSHPILIPFFQGGVQKTPLSEVPIQEVSLNIHEIPPELFAYQWLTDTIAHCIKFMKVHQRRNATKPKYVIPDLVVP